MTAEHDDNRRILERLSNALGPTGFEGPVREIVREELEPVVNSIGNDGLGSVISELKGDSSSPRIMFAAHMDELGLMVRRITPEGYIKIQPLGGWLDQALINQRWIILTREGEIPGVSGIKTPHVMSQDARSKIFKRDDIFIDVGANSKQDAEDRLNIRPGDAIAPASYFQEMEGNCLYMGKAWDDRAGVAVMLQTMKRLKQLGHPNTVYGVATVQEEVGLRGAQTSAFAVSPDIGISLESGVAGDYPGITADEAQELVGSGPGIFLHDSSMLPNNRLRDFVVDIAQDLNIPLQFNVLSGYGQDGAAIQKTGAGVPAINVTVPTRYLHSHTGVIHRDDVEGAIQLMVELVRRLDDMTVEKIKQFSCSKRGPTFKQTRLQLFQDPCFLQ